MTVDYGELPSDNELNFGEAVGGSREWIEYQEGKIRILLPAWVDQVLKKSGEDEGGASGILRILQNRGGLEGDQKKDRTWETCTNYIGELLGEDVYVKKSLNNGNQRENLENQFRVMQANEGRAEETFDDRQSDVVGFVRAFGFISFTDGGEMSEYLLMESIDGELLNKRMYGLPKEMADAFEIEYDPELVEVQPKYWLDFRDKMEEMGLVVDDLGARNVMDTHGKGRADYIIIDQGE